MMFLLSINVMAQELGNQLSEGDTKTFRFCEDNGDCGNYGVQVNYIGYNNIIDKNVVKLEVNGESIIMLSENESYTLADGSVLSITDILNQDFAGGAKHFWFLINGKQGTEVDQEISEEIEISPVSKPVDLSNYPDLFVKNSKLNFFLVVGTNSPSSDNLALSDIAVSFEKAGYKFKNAAKLDSEVSNPLNTNLIVFGKASDNTISDLLVGSVNNLLSPGEGMIKLFENNGKVQLLITGLTAEDRYQAAKFLAEKSLQLKVKEYIVPTSTNSTPVFFARNVTNQSNETKQTEKVVEPPKVVQQVGPPAPVTSPPQTEVKEEPKPVQIGEYEPLSEMPEKKGIFARLWGWIKSLF